MSAVAAAAAVAAARDGGLGAPGTNTSTHANDVRAATFAVWEECGYDMAECEDK